MCLNLIVFIANQVTKWILQITIDINSGNSGKAICYVLENYLTKVFGVYFGLSRSLSLFGNLNYSVLIHVSS